MPVVPFTTPSAATRSKASAPMAPPDEPWALMAAAQMHAEGRLIQVADKTGLPSAKGMSDEDYNSSWVRSIARQGRNDDQMKALHPDLDAYQLDDKSDLISYHKKFKATGDLTS